MPEIKVAGSRPFSTKIWQEKSTLHRPLSGPHNLNFYNLVMQQSVSTHVQNLCPLQPIFWICSFNSFTKILSLFPHFSFFSFILCLVIL